MASTGHPGPLGRGEASPGITSFCLVAPSGPAQVPPPAQPLCEELDTALLDHLCPRSPCILSHPYLSSYST